MKSLIVEDHFISRIVFQKMLAPYGQCDVAVNGKEAVEAFEHAIAEGEPYEAICLDIMMPEMDGHEALKIIREKEKEAGVAPKDEVKVIMMTALDTPKDVIEAYYNGGCTAYLVKPIEKAKLVAILEDFGLL